MALATITKVDPKSGKNASTGKEWKINYVTFQSGEKAVEAKAWGDDQFPVPIEVGQSAELAVKSETKGDRTELWVKSWGGESTKPARAGGGRPFGSAPKSPGDIAVMQACNINTASVEFVKSAVQFRMVKTVAGSMELLDAIHALLLVKTLKAVNELKGAVA